MGASYGAWGRKLCVDPRRGGAGANLRENLANELCVQRIHLKVGGCAAQPAPHLAAWMPHASRWPSTMKESISSYEIAQRNQTPGS